MCEKKATVRLVNACATNAGIGLHPQAADFVGCLLVAAMAVLPEFIMAMTTCLTSTDNPPSADYDPGDRNRCGNG